jgi:hypothetical protein
MMQHFDIDGPIEYGAQSLPATVRVVNPARRKLDSDVKKARQAERRLQAKVTIDSLPEDQRPSEFSRASAIPKSTQQ